MIADAEAFAAFARRKDMLFDTKVALIIRTDLAAWQKLNVAAFLASGIAAAYPETIGDPYLDASETTYLRLLGRPVIKDSAPKAAPRVFFGIERLVPFSRPAKRRGRRRPFPVANESWRPGMETVRIFPLSA